MVFHVITAVWGDPYIDLFLGTAIPNQLSAGNLDALPAGSRYRIFTRADDRARFGQLRLPLPIDLIVMDSTDGESKYDQMTRYHRRATEEALRDGATLIFLAPDVVLATGTLGRLVELRREGYRAVAILALRLVRESVVAALSDGRAVSPRALVRLAMQHLHPMHDNNRFDAADDRFSRYPTAVLWPVGDAGLIARCLNLHPLMLDPARQELPRNQIDGRYLHTAVPDPAEVYMVADSDDLAIFELTPFATPPVERGRRSWSKVWRVASVACRSDSHQIAFWQRPIILHSGDVTPEWAPVERAAARFARQVLIRRDVARRFFPLMNGIRRLRQRWDHRLRDWRRQLPKIRVKQVKRPFVIALNRTRKRVQKAIRAS